MRKVNWRWFRFIRERQPDIPLAYHRAEEALDGGDDVEIKPPPKSAFLKSLREQDNTVLGMGAAFIVAILILFAIILSQQGTISNQNTKLRTIPKLKQNVKSQSAIVAVKNKTIISQAAELRMYKAYWKLEKFYKGEAEAAKQELKEAQK